MEKLLGGYTLQELIENRISQMFGVNGAEATPDQIYRATATAVNDVLRSKRREFNTKVRDGQLKRV